MTNFDLTKVEDFFGDCKKGPHIFIYHYVFFSLRLGSLIEVLRTSYLREPRLLAGYTILNIACFNMIYFKRFPTRPHT